MLENIIGKGLLLGIGIPLILLAIVGGAVYTVYVIKFRYRTASANEALVITGSNLKGDNVYTDANGRSVMIIRGGGYRLRMFQTAKKALLHSFQISMKTPTVYVEGGIPIVVDAIATVKVADELENIVKFAEQYMGKRSDDISNEIAAVLNTNLRAILAKLSVEEINNNRESFAQQVQEIAEKELLNMGFTITSFGIEDVRDAIENGYISNLGRPRLAKVREIAEKAESDTDKNVRIHKSENDKLAREEETRRNIEISKIMKAEELEKQKNLAETQKEKAITEQVYELEKTRKEREIQEAQLKLEYSRKEELVRQTELTKKEALVRAELEAEQSAIRAESNKRVLILDGEAEAKVKKLQAQTEAEIIATRSVAEAESRVREGNAEAENIRNIGSAEAESKQAMAKAIQEYGEYAIIEMIMKTLPQMAEHFANSYNNVDEIKIIDMGSGGTEGANGVNALTSNITKNITGIQNILEESTGIDLKALMETFVARGLNLPLQQNQQLKKGKKEVVEKNHVVKKNDLQEEKSVDEK